ncbi:MAG: MMPL family transporter [Clostridia bacterium]
MKKFSTFIVKHKFIILSIFLLVLITSGICLAFFVNVNSDIISYLPEGTSTSDGLAFMQKTFNMKGDAEIAIDNTTEAEVADIVKFVSGLEGIKEGGVVWYGTFDQMAQMEIPEVGGVQIDKDALLEAIKTNPDVLKVFKPQEDMFMIMLQLSIAPGSDEAIKLLKDIDKELDKRGVEYAVGGSTQITKDIFDSTIGEVDKYLIVALLVVVIILILATTSFLEPLILLITLGVSILVNMGTNFIFKDVSVVTFACSSILQLALSVDYAIFMMHCFYQERLTAKTDEEAMQRTIPKTFSTIMSSSLTTVAGFVALFFMKFKMGGDLGLVLAKGVFLSMLTVIILQPCLILLFNKVLKKTSHRILVPNFSHAGSFSIKHRKVIVSILLVLFIPAFIIGTFKVDYSYVKFMEPKANPTEAEQCVQVMGNSLMVLVPVNDPEKHKEFIEEVKKVEGVHALTGIYSILPEEVSKYVPMMALIPQYSQMLKGYVNGGYTMYSLMLNVGVESDEASSLLQQVSDIAHNKFANKTIYITGMVQAVSDLAKITPTDFLVVSLVSILMIFLILWVTLKSFSMTVILIAVIEFGIFINLSILVLQNLEINFMAYIIISSIQLGSTIDYAILYTVKFKRLAQNLPIKQSAYLALKESGASIITSASIIACACFGVYLVTSNKIVGEITMLIARGAIISCLLVMLVLPAVISTFVRRVKKDVPFEMQEYVKLNNKLKKKSLKSKANKI